MVSTVEYSTLAVGIHGRLRAPDAMKYDEEVWITMTAAWREARRLGHDQVSPDHVLLGLTGDPCDPMKRLFDGVHVDVAEVHGRAKARLRPPSIGEDVRELQYAVSTKEVMRDALEEAVSARNTSVVNPHVLLALMERGGIAAEVFAELGMTVERIRAETIEVLRPNSGHSKTMGASPTTRNSWSLLKNLKELRMAWLADRARNDHRNRWLEDLESSKD